jgi:hypothetical protein
LIEVIVTMSILLSVTAFLTINAVSALEKYSDPRSEYRVAMEVKFTTNWIESILRRSLVSLSDVRFTVPYSTPSPNIKILWLVSSHSEERVSDVIEFRSVSSSIHTYNHSAQTLSPALLLHVYVKDESGNGRMTDWRISVSGYGFVRAYREPSKQARGLCAGTEASVA